MEEDRPFDVQSVAKEDVDRLRDLVKGIRVAMMVTVDAEGKLRSRPMATLEFADDGVLWFLTSGASGKVEEMERDHRVHLTYASPGLDRYVAISGMASLVDDRSKIRSLWSPMFRAWWPKGAEDPDVALVRVVAHEAEYWDAPGRPLFAAVGAIRAMAFGKAYDKEQKDHHHIQLRTWPESAGDTGGVKGAIGRAFGGGASKDAAKGTPSMATTGATVGTSRGPATSKAAVGTSSPDRSHTAVAAGGGAGGGKTGSTRGGAAHAPMADRTPTASASASATNREDLKRDRSRQQSGTGYATAPADEGAPVRERADVTGEGPHTPTSKKSSRSKAKAKA